jgi:DNA-binding transcriptional LysR family regulator
MIATRVGSIRFVVCASPAYLTARGHPEKPDDLLDHDCVTVGDVAVPPTWRFAMNGHAMFAPAPSRLNVNTSEAAIEAAIADAGLIRVMSYKMEAAARAGKLAAVLEDFEEEPLPVHVVFAERKPVPLKLSAFLNWATPRIKARLTSQKVG